MPIRLLRLRPVCVRSVRLYGPEWFTGGTFIGAGPWYHGEEHFAGNVDNHYDIHRAIKANLRRYIKLPRTSIPRKLPT